MLHAVYDLEEHEGVWGIIVGYTRVIEYFISSHFESQNITYDCKAARFKKEMILREIR